MSEIKKQDGIMSKPTENEETSFMARLIPDLSERRAAGQIVRDALVGFSTLFGNPATQLGAMQEQERLSDQRTAATA
jgi:spore maturation protein SpmA